MKTNRVGSIARAMHLAATQAAVLHMRANNASIDADELTVAIKDAVQARIPEATDAFLEVFALAGMDAAQEIMDRRKNAQGSN